MKKLRVYVPALIIAILLSLIGFSQIAFAHGDQKHEQKQSEKISYAKNVKPIFDKQCVFCHGEDSAEHTEFMKDMKKYTSQSLGPRLDNYTYLTSFIVWPETGALMRMLDDGTTNDTGTPGAMYENLGDTKTEQQANLKIFKEWVGNWTVKKWDEISKEDINKMKLGY
jgi:hypothetical protein